jgi:hypothetical protein
MAWRLAMVCSADRIGSPNRLAHRPAEAQSASPHRARGGAAADPFVLKC